MTEGGVVEDGGGWCFGATTEGRNKRSEMKKGLKLNIYSANKELVWSLSCFRYELCTSIKNSAWRPLK